MAPKIIYFCDCDYFCEGTRKKTRAELGRSQWYAHASMRSVTSPCNNPFILVNGKYYHHRLERRTVKRRNQLLNMTQPTVRPTRSPSPSPTRRSDVEPELFHEDNDAEHQHDYDFRDPVGEDSRSIDSARSVLSPSPGPASRDPSRPGSPLLPQNSLAEEDVENEHDGKEWAPLLPEMQDSVIDDFLMSQRYIDAVQSASLDNGDLSAEALERLRNPPTSPLELDESHDRDLLLSLRLFLAQTTGSQKNYTDSVSAIHKAGLGVELLSHHLAKQKVEQLSGVCGIENDMCPNSCIGYTAFNKDLDTCPVCKQPRYFSVSDTAGARTAKQSFLIIPPGPQIQALHRSAGSAEQMLYFEQQTQRILSELEDDQPLQEFGDVCTGTDVLDALRDGRMEATDTVLMLSLDGAQLYRNKASDCWMLIWVVFNISPDLRYKKKYVLPGGVIPGPHKPKNVDSFLFPALHHIAAVNRAGGLPIWSAHRAQQADPTRPALYKSKIFMLLATADGPGMVYMSGLVGHSGKNGCRLWCGLTGRRVPGQRGGHYYPALAKPHNYVLAGSDHSDRPYDTVESPDPARYADALLRVSAARNQTNYQDLRLETGIGRPSILLGLDMSPDRPMILGMPNMCPGDIMHELSNLALHLLKLWRGKIDCIAPDNRNAWRWMVLTGDLWKRHGQCVADSKPFLPGSFDRPPRNPAEKINSGYKAWELIQYVFELGPGLLLGVLPAEFWENYCKLVAAIRLLSQRQIKLKDLERAYVLVVEFIEEFERLYYQRIPERLHFLPQIIHNLQHMPYEVCRLGLGGYYSQWTMERTIGNLTEEIKQHSDPYRNLSMRALRRAQVNALKAIYPAIEETSDREKLVATAIPLDLGYALLRKRDRKAQVVKGAAAAAIEAFREQEGAPRPTNPKYKLKVQRYARLALPNGQVARSRWAERSFQRIDLRQACNVKLEYGNDVFFAEVEYYFQTKVNGAVRTMAMLSLFGQPDIALLKRSAYTLWSCERPTGEMIVLDYHLIKSVVAMVPFSEAIQGAEFADRVFVVEKVGLDVAPMANALDFDELTKDGEEVDEEDEEM